MSMDGQFLSLSAEYLVAADLANQGYAVSTAAEGLPYDLIVDLGNRLLKVQVKSTKGIKKAISGQKTEYYVFKTQRDKAVTKYDHNSFDIIAFVALDRGLIAYMPANETLNLSSIYFTKPEETGSTIPSIDLFPLKKALESIIFTYEEFIQKFSQVGFSFDEELTKAFGRKSNG